MTSPLTRGQLVKELERVTELLGLAEENVIAGAELAASITEAAASIAEAAGKLLAAVDKFSAAKMRVQRAARIAKKLQAEGAT